VVVSRAISVVYPESEPPLRACPPVAWISLFYPLMERILPQELEKKLSGDLSHLILKLNSPDVAASVHSFLEHRGIAIREERVFRDEEQMTWLLLSFDRRSASALAMELVEEGFSGTIVAGIDAKGP